MWRDDVKRKIHELELIAQWASLVNLGQVRDAIRNAEWHLKKELESPRCMEEDMLRVGLVDMPLNEAEKFDHDPERRRRRELAEYAIRQHGEDVPSA